jgi:hypothetical protein
MTRRRAAPDGIAELLALPENTICADCRQKQAKWASSTLGVFLCIDCSGIHRSLGTHISFVRSCTLDSWSPEQIRFMREVGNGVADEYWEANLPPDFEHPDPTNSYQMANFIRQKYVHRRWAASEPPPAQAASISAPLPPPPPPIAPGHPQPPMAARAPPPPPAAPSHLQPPRLSSVPPAAQAAPLLSAGDPFPLNPSLPRQTSSPDVRTESRKTSASLNGVVDALDEFFAPVMRDPPNRGRRRQPAATGVSSPDRKPGKKLPQRLVRKLRQQEDRPVIKQEETRQQPKTVTSAPNLAAFAGDSDDSDDPFA